MKLFAAAAVALCAITWGAAASAEGAAKLCDKPRQMEGFKTCADVDKAEAEGAFVLYSTDPVATIGGALSLDPACVGVARSSLAA